MGIKTDAETKLWLAKRTLFYILGLIVMAFGVAMSIRAEIGVAPGGAISVAIYMFVPFTVGQCTAMFNIFCVIMQFVITRRLTLKHIFQLPMAYVFGMLLDVFYNILVFDHPSIIYNYIQVVVGMFIFSFGIRTIVGANIILAPPDGLARAAGDLFNWPMSKSKLVFDIVVTIIAALITYIFGRNLFMVVGFGTLITAVFTGPLIGLFTKLIPYLDTEKNFKKKVAP